MLTTETHRPKNPALSEKLDLIQDDPLTVIHSIPVRAKVEVDPIEVEAEVEVDPNLELAEELRGRTIKITKPMLTMFDEIGWPVLQPDFAKRTEEQKERYLRLRRDTEDILDLALVGNPKRLKRAKECDFALFNIVWYPEYEDYEILWAASLITTWLFIWDDYVDSNDGSLAKDFDRATAWRTEALSSARQLLGLDESVTEPKTPTGPMIVLAEYARLIKPRLNREQIERIFHDIELFIEASGREQANRMAGYIPKTLEEYLDTRQFSSAVYPCLLTLELGISQPLPRWVMQSEEMKAILKAGNWLISLHNDILSFKKELANCCLINSIPVLYRAGVPWDDIIPHLDIVLRGCCQLIDQSAEILVKKVGVDAALTRAVGQFVEGVRINVTGNVSYSLFTERYRCVIKNNMQPDGSIEVVI